MSWTNAIATAAVVLRFLDPYTAVEQTDDPKTGASWAGDPDHWPVPVGLVDPMESPYDLTLAERVRRKLGLPAKEEKPTPRVVHARFKTWDEPPAEYDPEEPSPLFKVNQVGYLPDKPKYAYLGGWLGPALGAWRPHGKLAGWQLVDAASGEVVKDSALPPLFRVPDGYSKEGTPFTGEETFEMDFSDVSREGTYFLRVPGVGRSRDFRIASGAAEDAFRVHMGGLYQKRCGIAKEEPYTHWTAGACHVSVVRGSFPPEEGTLSPQTRWFDIIRTSTDWRRGDRLLLPGGWHDAADYDRRPQHLGIVCDLCAVWMARPGNFRDGQLRIPENDNGIPDILDEADWGLNHLLAGQQADGGVGTWIESTGHPAADNVAEKDPMPYALSLATRRSSLMYAAAASQLARCHESFREKYLESARRAWTFALNEKPKTKLYPFERTEWRVIKSVETVYWDEDRELPAPYLVKAAVNLHALTGESHYLDAVVERLPKVLEDMAANGWGWPALLFTGEMAMGTPPPLDSFFEKWKWRVVRNADIALGQLEKSYAYRVPWWAPQEGWVHAMGYGNAHPLVQARKFVAAHALTGDKRYLDAASLANDFHNGCNPTGSTLTSGLGQVYPVAFLDIPSYVDGIAEYVPGITPYRWTYAVPRKVVSRVFGGDRDRAVEWPIWRRWGNLENQTVGASEYTVWETIGPAACVTGYLTTPSGGPPPPQREPAKSLRELEGYWVLP